MLVVRIGVIGNSGQITDEIKKTAYRIGFAVGKQGGILLTGGRDGVMEAATRGAKKAGGLTVGILPGDDINEGNSYLDVPLTTGLNFEYRSLILIHSSDAIIMVGGAVGTLLELTSAYHNKKPVVILPATGGWSAKIREIACEGKYLDERRKVELIYADSPEEAVAKAYKAIEIETRR